jgi:type I restriction enzyme R subunit
LGYIIVDAVGVTKSQKTTSRQLERKPAVSLKELMISVAMGAHDDDTLTSLASRLVKLDKLMTDTEKECFVSLCEKEGVRFGTVIEGNITVPCEENIISPKGIAETLLNAFDEDIIENVARKKYHLSEDEIITDAQYNTVSEQMAIAASIPFNNPKVRGYIENARKSHDQVIDNVNIDEVTFRGWDSEHSEKAGETYRNIRAVH